MDFVAGMDDEKMVPLPERARIRDHMDPLFDVDENRVRAEFLYLFQNVNVVESMLVAINHMQVDVCYFRHGLTGFRKNIISFFFCAFSFCSNLFSFCILLHIHLKFLGQLSAYCLRMIDIPRLIRL